MPVIPWEHDGRPDPNAEPMPQWRKDELARKYANWKEDGDFLFEDDEEDE